MQNKQILQIKLRQDNESWSLRQLVSFVHGLRSSARIGSRPHLVPTVWPTKLDYMHEDVCGIWNIIKFWLGSLWFPDGYWVIDVLARWSNKWLPKCKVMSLRHSVHHDCCIWNSHHSLCQEQVKKRTLASLSQTILKPSVNLFSVPNMQQEHDTIR